MADRSLNKIVIKSYKDKGCTEGQKLGEFVVPINPESYVQNLKVKLDKEKGQGKEETDPKYNSTDSEEFKLEVMLDGTKTMEGYDASHAKKTVKEQLEDFKKSVYYVVTETHRPPFVKIFWGAELSFSCVLSQMDINYTLFNPDGSPLRIKISATFLKYVAQEPNKASPDVTHEKIAKAGERLDLLTYNIYNDPKYFLQVAAANRLTSVRKLKTATKLYFPPFNKTEA